MVRLLRRLAHLESLIYINITNKLDIRMRLRPWLKMTGLSLLFHWANDELKLEYRKGLEKSGLQFTVDRQKAGTARPTD